MKLDQIRARLKAIVARQQEIVDGVGDGDLSDAQAKEFDELAAEFEKLAAQRDFLEGGPGRRTPAPAMQPPGPESPTHRRNPRNDVFEDEEGNRITALMPDESLRDFYAENGYIDSNSAPAVGLGDAIRGLITGKWPEQSLGIQAALSTGQDAAGGFWLPPMMSSELIDLARNASVAIQAGARTIPMTSVQLAMVRVTGDPTVAWTAENATIAKSEPTFGRITFRARKLAARVAISYELANDAPNAAQQIQAQLGTVLGIEIDRAALLGSGDGEEPVGLFNATGVQEIGSVGTLEYDDFLDAIQLVEDQNGMPGAYISTPSAKNTLAKTKDSQGNYLEPPPDLRALRRLVTKQLANSQAALGDFAQLLLGVLGGVRIEISRVGDEAWAKDQIEIKIRWRGDVQFARPAHLVKLTGIS